MAAGAVMIRGGKLLIVGGKIATSSDCCCPDHTCGACCDCTTVRINLNFSHADLAYLNGNYDVTAMGSPPEGWSCGYEITFSDYGVFTFQVGFDEVACLWIVNIPHSVYDTGSNEWATSGDMQFSGGTEAACFPMSVTRQAIITEGYCKAPINDPISGLVVTVTCLEWGP